MRNKLALVSDNEPKNTLVSETLTTRSASSIAAPSARNAEKARDGDEKERLHSKSYRVSRRSGESADLPRHELGFTTARLEGTVLLRGLLPAIKERYVNRQAYKPLIHADEHLGAKIFADSSARSQWPVITSVLDEWRALEDGWDGEDALAPSHKVLDIVSTFATMAENHGVSEPRPFIDSSGEIGFIWGSLSRASVSFSMNDRFSAFCPREGKADLRIAGPLDIAVCSSTLFKSLREHSAL